MTTERKMENEGADNRHDSGEFPRAPIASMVAPIAAPPPWGATVDSTFRIDPIASEALGEPVYIERLVDPALPSIGRGSTEGVYALGDAARGTSHRFRAWDFARRPDRSSTATVRNVAGPGEAMRLEIVPEEPPLPACFGEEPFLLSARPDLVNSAERLDGGTLEELYGQAVEIIDRLAAYLKGGDVRLIRAGAIVDACRRDERLAERGIAIEDAEKEATIAELRALIRAACPAVKLIEQIATMTDTECEFEDMEDLRHAARLAVAGKPFTSPLWYSEEDRQRATEILGALKLDNGAPVYRNMHGGRAAECVDMIAEALGMRRAGA